MKPKEIKTKSELLKVLKPIPFRNKEHKLTVICSLIGHSKISTGCFGYRNCARCGGQLGASLGSIDPGKETAVIINHSKNCKDCKSNYKKCTWKDKIYVKNPFPKN